MNLCLKISNFTLVSFPATETVPIVLGDGYAPVICNHGPSGARIAGLVPCLELRIVPAVPWNCGAFDSMPKPAGVSHLAAGILAGLLAGLRP